MFSQARIKLTLWYLLIIMSVSLFFSLVIYRGLVGEVNRISRMEQLRFERGPFEYRVFHPVILEPEIVNGIKNRITLTLAVINGVILIGAGCLGYFLAGKTLEPISRMVDEQNRFISDASHEFRTPLTSLKTSMEVSLRDKNLDLKIAKKTINESLDEVNKLQSLSEGLLQMTQQQDYGNNLKFERLFLLPVVNQAVDRVKAVAKLKNIRIKNKTINYQIRGNRYSLTDLVVILLDNAIKYSDRGSSVTVDSEKTDRSVLIRIKDQGMGIEKKDIPHIFDRFYRADKVRTKSSDSGYGLGLSIAKKIADNHRGTILVESKTGKGTTMTVSLPKFS